MAIHHKGHQGHEESEVNETFRNAKGEAKDWTAAIIGCAMRVHTYLGAGLLESIYEECLCRELMANGISFQRQLEIPVQYRGERLPVKLRIDLLVQEEVIVEAKSVERLLPVHDAQLLTYLRLTGKHLGLLLNFNEPHLRHGIRRKIWTPARAITADPPSRGPLFHPSRS